MSFIRPRTALLVPPIDPDALKHRASVIAAGGTYSRARLQLNSRMIRALKASAVWPSLDRLWIFAGENTQQALIDLVARASATLPVAPALAANRGYLGNGSSQYIDLGVAASALVKGTQNDIHISQYLRDGDSATNTVIGSRDSGSGFSSEQSVSVTGTCAFIINTGSAATNFVLAPQTGLFIAERVNTSATVAHNGVDVSAQDVGASSSRATSTMVALARNTSGTISAFSGCRIAACSFGAALGASGRPALSAALNAYMTAVGANVY